MNIVDILFYLFASLSLGGAGNGVLEAPSFRCDVHDYFSSRCRRIICFIRSILLAVLQILVYAGAVMVLFLFIIMLLDVGPEGGKASRMKLISGLAAAFSISLLIVIFLIIVKDYGLLNGSVSWSALPESTELTQGLVFSTAVKFWVWVVDEVHVALADIWISSPCSYGGVIVLSKKTKRRLAKKWNL